MCVEKPIDSLLDFIKVLNTQFRKPYEYISKIKSTHVHNHFSLLDLHMRIKLVSAKMFW